MLSLGQAGEGHTVLLAREVVLASSGARDSSGACDLGSCFSIVKSFQQHSVFNQNGQNRSWQNTKLVGGSSRKGQTVQWERVSYRPRSRGHSWGKKNLSIKSSVRASLFTHPHVEILVPCQSLRGRQCLPSLPSRPQKELACCPPGVGPLLFLQQVACSYGGS